MDTVRADHERRMRIGTANGVRQLSDAALQRSLDGPVRQDLVVRVLGGTTETVTIDPVEWHNAGAGPLTVAHAKVDDLGPAEQLQTLNRMRWRDEFAGCRRVLVAWDVWAAHLAAGRRAETPA